jgi:hypothetical protein
MTDTETSDLRARLDALKAWVEECDNCDRSRHLRTVPVETFLALRSFARGLVEEAEFYLNRAGRLRPSDEHEPVYPPHVEDAADDAEAIIERLERAREGR